VIFRPFNYISICGCGIPSIELTGTPEDWESIRDRASALRDFDMGFWIDHLDPVLEQFVNASKGRADKSFWTSICNLLGGSGIRSPITGWIQVFFPYLLNGKGYSVKRNSYLGAYNLSITNNAQNDLEWGLFSRVSGCGNGVKLKEIPGGISKVPFVWLDANTNKADKMIFSGGIVYCTQDSTDGTIEPKIGWAVLG